MDLADEYDAVVVVEELADPGNDGFGPIDRYDADRPTFMGVGAPGDADPGSADEGGQDWVVVDDPFDSFEWCLDDGEEPDRLMVALVADVGALASESDAEVAVFIGDHADVGDDVGRQFVAGSERVEVDVEK